MSISFDAFDGVQLWGELFEVPLMAAMFLAMVWHARRRVEAQRIAEGRAEERRSMLERQERFIHDASHELRTPLTIARGHLELVRPQGPGEAELDVALEELARIDAIIERLLVLATADQPDFLRAAEIDLEPFLEDVFMRWSEVAPRAWRLGPLVAGRLLADPERLRAALDALLENAVKYTRGRDAIELRARVEGVGRVVIEVAGRRAAASRPRRSSGSSIALRASMRRGPAPRAASASVWRSLTRSRRGTADAAPWSAPGRARSSRCTCRISRRTAGSRSRRGRFGLRATRADPRERRRVDLSCVHLLAHEQRRRRHDPGTDAGCEIPLDPRRDGVAAAVFVEPVDVKPESLRAIPQMGILEPTLVGEQQIVHLPEMPLEPCRLGRAGGGPRARMARANGKVPEHSPQPQPCQLHAHGGAVRALEVGVLDHQRGVRRTAEVVLATRRRDGRGAEAHGRVASAAEAVEDQVGAGQIRGRRSLVAPLHDEVGPHDH